MVSGGFGIWVWMKLINWNFCMDRDSDDQFVINRLLILNQVLDGIISLAHDKKAVTIAYQ